MEIGAPTERSPMSDGATDMPHVPGSPGRGLRALADLTTPMAVRVAATLRVADHLAAGRRRAADIARVAGADADALDRLMRHLVTIGLLTRDGEEYRTTAIGDRLRTDHSGSRRQWLDNGAAIGRGDLSFVDLEHSVRTGRPAYRARYGRSFWADLESDPELARTFDETMGHHVQLDMEGLEHAYDWSRVGHVVDVGGGDGTMATRLLRTHGSLRVTVVDLAGPTEAAARALRREGLTSRAEVVAQSFFDPLPAGADAYLLSAVIHDWDDDDAVAILRRCVEAAGATGTVLVVEAVGVDDETPDTTMDLRMLVYVGGRERGLSALTAVALRAGLRLTGVHRLPHGPRLALMEFVAR